MWERPLTYMIVIPATLAVGMITAFFLAAISTLGVPFDFIAPVCLVAMLGFAIWARTDKDGQVQVWPE